MTGSLTIKLGSSGGGGSTAWGAITGKPANVTAFGDLANAAGVLANNGSGTLSYTAASTGGNGAADSGKILMFDSGGGITSTGFTSQVNDLLMNLQSTGVLLSDTSSIATLDMRVAYLEFVSAAGDAVTTLYPSATVGTRALYFPAAAGTLVSTGDTGTVTGTMLAGSIAPSKITGTAAILGANTFTGALTIPVGSAAATTLNFGTAGTGIYSASAAASIDVAIAGTRRYTFDGVAFSTNGAGITVTGGNYIGGNTYLRQDGPALRFGASDDVAIGRDGAAETLALGRRNASANTLRIYGTYTDASNYVRLALTTTSTTMSIVCQTAGTGADDIDLTLTPAGTGNVRFGTHSAVGAETVTGFITIKDSGGTSRKLAVIS